MTAEIIAQVKEDCIRLEGLPLGKSIADLLFDAAKTVPNQIALDFFEDGVRITYADFEDQVRRLAVALSKIGVERGSAVGVMVSNRQEFPISWLAITALQAVMVPLNTNYTPREIEYVLKQSGASHLIVEATLLDSLSTSNISDVFNGVIITIGAQSTAPHHSYNEIVSQITNHEAITFSSSAEVDDLSNIQFTSGSTGMPKGCRQKHRFWLEVSLFIAEIYQPRHKRILIHQSMFYMDPQFLMLSAIRNHGTAFIARRPSSTRFFNWVERNDIEFMFLPEFVYKQADLVGRKFPSVKRAMIFGWGANNHIKAEEILNFPLREGFGMTEIGMATYLPENATSFVGKRSCGLPGPFRECKIMASSNRAAKPGETGELWVRGPGVIDAYHDNPLANETSFSDGWFHTGDLAMQDENGFFYYVGRLKDMIRRSGENIAAQEVEAVLRTAPYVTEAAVVPVRDDARGEEVKAFVTCLPNILLEADKSALLAILDTCFADLAPFKIPRYIEQIKEFPRTGSNKIAKNTLISTSDLTSKRHYDRKTDSWLQYS